MFYRYKFFIFVHLEISQGFFVKIPTPTGFEPAISDFHARCSTQLSSNLEILLTNSLVGLESLSQKQEAHVGTPSDGEIFRKNFSFIRKTYLINYSISDMLFNDVTGSCDYSSYVPCNERLEETAGVETLALKPNKHSAKKSSKIL